MAAAEDLVSSHAHAGRWVGPLPHEHSSRGKHESAQGGAGTAGPQGEATRRVSGLVSHSWLPAAQPPVRFPTFGSTLGFRFGSSLSAPGSVPHLAPGSVSRSAPGRSSLDSRFGSPLSAPSSVSRSAPGSISPLGPRFFFLLGPDSMLAWLPPYSAFLHLPRLRFGVCLKGSGHFLRPSRRRHVLP